MCNYQRVSYAKCFLNNLIFPYLKVLRFWDIYSISFLFRLHNIGFILTPEFFAFYNYEKVLDY